MGRRCCVVNCPSTSRLLEHHGVTYHSFPLDPVIRAIWIKNSRVSLDRQITKSVLVCSRHFRRLDFNTIRNGKYLLKPRVFPTVFPWGKMDSAEIEADHRALQQASVEGTAVAGTEHASANEDVIKATVDNIVAQILAETAERNSSAATEEPKAPKADKEKDQAKTTTPPQASEEAPKPTEDSAAAAAVVQASEVAAPTAAATSASNSPLPGTPVKYSNPTNLTIGARLEALSVEGNWLPARIVEVNETEQTLLVRFERNHKLKVSPSTSGSFQEWMAIKSERLRQRLSNRVLPVFELEEKCMARWSGPRKFPGTIRKLLGNDTYEVLFDDGYTKNVRAVHMNKLPKQLLPVEGSDGAPVKATATAPAPPGTPVPVPAAAPVAPKRVSTGSVSSTSAGSSSKKSKSTPQRRDWPLLDMASLDIGKLDKESGNFRRLNNLITPPNSCSGFARDSA